MLWGSALAAVSGAHGFALIGGCRSPACFAGGEYFQPFDREFRWSAPLITVAASASFFDAFGQGGIDALDRSLDRWAAASISDPAQAPESTRIPARESGIVYDLESILVHEIGHALGLGHPDRAAAGGMNYAPDGSPVASTGTEVMYSGMPNATVIRGLTRDDVAGIRYVYDEGNVNPLDGPGIGILRFLRVDMAVAEWGVDRGANIDLFATTNSERPGLFRGGALATAAISLFANDLLHEPGIINGLHAAGPVVAGVDIYINLDRPIALLHPVPEPGLVILAAAAVLIPVRRRR